MPLIAHELKVAKKVSHGLIAFCLIALAIPQQIQAIESDNQNDQASSPSLTPKEISRIRLEKFKKESDAIDRARARLIEMGYNELTENHEYSYTGRPSLLIDILPFRMSNIDESLPLALFLNDQYIGSRLRSDGLSTIFEAFNIQLIGEIDNDIWPTVVEIEISLQGKTTDSMELIRTNMRLDSMSNAYYFANPFEAYQSIMNIVRGISQLHQDEFGRDVKPKLDIVALRGFKPLADMIEPEHFPGGIAINHNIRLGNVRIISGYSWLGRPVELLSLLPSPQFLQ